MASRSAMQRLDPKNMVYRFLGNTGLKVSALSFGSWCGYETARDCMQEAWDHGVNSFDTAEVYASGECERAFGQILKELQFKWSDMVISTKLFWGGAGPNDTGLSKKHLFEGMNASLERLGLDYVDVVMAHRPDRKTPMEEIVRAFTQIVNSGQALYWDTSDLIPPVCDQPQYNMFWRERVEGELAPVLANYRHGLAIWSPLDNGVLTGKYNEGIPADSRFAATNAAASDKENMVNFGKALSSAEGKAKIERVRRLTQIATELGCTTAQLALARCLLNETVSTVITGASRPAQMTENMTALDVYKKIKGMPDVVGRIEQILGNRPAEPELWGRWN
ncbi:NADP-dependent oxidoreductase domain-containing protein [Aspergillus germanicus]